MVTQGNGNPKLKIDKNHNNNLNCWSFLVIRPEKPHFIKAQVLDVYFRDNYVGRVMVNDVQPIKFEDLTLQISLLTIGYNEKYLKTTLTRIYQKAYAPMSMEFIPFVLMTCSWIGEVPKTIDVPKNPKIEKEQSKMYPVDKAPPVTI